MTIIKLVSNTLRLVGGLLATATAIALCFGAASGVWGIAGTLAALSYLIADNIDLYGLFYTSCESNNL